MLQLGDNEELESGTCAAGASTASWTSRAAPYILEGDGVS